MFRKDKKKVLKKNNIIRRNQKFPLNHLKQTFEATLGKSKFFSYFRTEFDKVK